MAKKQRHEFHPNPYDGFRATTLQRGGEILIFLSMTGAGKAIEDRQLLKLPDTEEGRGLADVAFLLAQSMAICLNAGMSLTQIDTMVSHMSILSETYQVSFPKDWFFLTTAGLDLGDYQMIYAKKGSKEAVIVSPDEYTDHTTLDDIVYEGRQNVVTPGRGGETPKIQHQSNPGEAAGDSSGSEVS